MAEQLRRKVKRREQVRKAFYIWIHLALLKGCKKGGNLKTLKQKVDNIKQTLSDTGKNRKMELSHDIPQLGKTVYLYSVR